MERRGQSIRRPSARWRARRPPRPRRPAAAEHRPGAGSAGSPRCPRHRQGSAGWPVPRRVGRAQLRRAAAPGRPQRAARRQQTGSSLPPPRRQPLSEGSPDGGTGGDWAAPRETGRRRRVRCSRQRPAPHRRAVLDALSLPPLSPSADERVMRTTDQGARQPYPRSDTGLARTRTAGPGALLGA